MAFLVITYIRGLAKLRSRARAMEATPNIVRVLEGFGEDLETAILLQWTENLSSGRKTFSYCKFLTLEYLVGGTMLILIKYPHPPVKLVSMIMPNNWQRILQMRGKAQKR